MLILNIIYFGSLPKLYYYYASLVKNINQKDLVKMVESELTCPK